MSTKRKIIAVTGARSEYDLLSPLYNRLHHNPNCDFSIVVTGPHLSEAYGKTINQIEDDNFKIVDRIYSLINTDEKAGRIISLGNQITGLTQTLIREKPDVVLIAGDREEAISVTMTCAFLDIAVAHFFGGDVVKDGNIDNSIRYAASKFAHIHFPAVEKHKETLIKLGEDDGRIYVIGSPALDKFVNTPITTVEELNQNLPSPIIENEEFLLLIQHPIITQVDQQANHIRASLDAIVESGLKCFINYPNTDAGNEAIIEAYEEYAGKYDNFIVFKNLDRLTYINILRKASCLIGNSSSGLYEAPTIGLPAVNVGMRQRGRISGENVIFVDNDKEQILEAINKSVYNQEYRDHVKRSKNPYGDGDSAIKAEEVLMGVEINDWLIYKNITY